MGLPEGFGRISKLTEDQQLYIRNWLIRGGESLALARYCQQEWKIWSDVNERTLGQQLNRYKKHLLETATEELPAVVNQHGAVIVKATRNRNIDPLERMVALLEIQEKRLQMFLNKEQQISMPIKGVDDVIKDAAGMIKDIQRMRFELGLDQYHVAQPGAMVRGVSKTVTTPDGTKTQHTLFEAVSMADQALARAGIPSDLEVLGRNIDGADTQG